MGGPHLGGRGDPPGPPEAAPRFDFAALVETWLRLLEELVREGVAGGEFRPCNPAHVALVLTGALEVSTRPHVFNPGGENAGAQLDGMLSVVLEGLVLDAPSGLGRRGRQAPPPVPDAVRQIVADQVVMKPLPIEPKPRRAVSPASGPELGPTTRKGRVP